MKAIGFFALAALSGLALLETAAAEPLTTVDAVDLKRYLGTWYEISRYPNRFQRKCQSDTTARYSLRPDGKIEVVNSCLQADGKKSVATGKAKVVDRRSNARLKVTFFWPFYGDYWIIGLDPEYRYAIVGEPKRKYLWILSRTPQLDDSTYKEAIGKVRAAGYDPAKLIRTAQSSRN